MHHRIGTILTQLRQDLAGHLAPESITTACRSVGHSWRACKLTPVVIVYWFVTQVLHGNTALKHVSLLAGRRFSDSAYCQARAHLPLAVFKAVLRGLVEKLAPETFVNGLWRGRRTFLADGSSYSTPDTPALQAEFGQPSNQARGCGFPVVRILVLFHAGTGFLVEVLTAPLCSHEMSRAGGIHPALGPGDVLVADRGFCSFAHFSMLLKRGVDGVFRMHQRQIVDFTPDRPHAEPRARKGRTGLPRSRWLRALGVLDQVVEWFKPIDPPDWMTAEEYAALPDALLIRELRYQVGRPGFRTHTVTLATTLLDADDYPFEALAELYGSRWRVEQNLRDLKQTMKMDVLKCMTVDGVQKELVVYAIVYNLVRLVMMEAARRQRVGVDRISFVDAMRWLINAEPGEELPELVVNPDRPGRVEPRVRKRRPKQYPLIKRPRAELRNDLMAKGLTA